MTARVPFVLLDDARSQGARDALLFEEPQDIFVARQPAEVADVLAAAENARRQSGASLAGYISYEAGLALEPRLAPRTAGRTGSGGPLVWFGLFTRQRRMTSGDVSYWLEENAGDGAATLGPLDPQLSPGSHRQAFDRLQSAIRAGDIYQANLTFHLAGRFRGSPLALYSAIRPRAAAGYGGIVFDGSHWLLSFSPELFFSLREREVKVRPMKGTRPRSQDEERDRALADELAASAKDRAENLMIVDLMRNDLSRVADPGSVTVEKPFAVETYPTVHQMVSTVSARLPEGKGAMDLVSALFPCGSITGTPKVRAMELIDDVERDARGPYCGAIGRIDGTGDAAFSVAIRTLRLAEEDGGGGRATLGVGSAIVRDSEWLQEWRECVVKGGFVSQSPAEGSVAGFDLIETMAFTPDDGTPLLEFHLERLKASASELGFAFDRHAARNQIQALCFELDAPSKLRLLLARTGATALEVSPLPPPLPDPVPCVAVPLPVDENDWRLRHKTSDRGFYESAGQLAADAGASEALLLRSDDLVSEGTFSNVFLERDGELLTPPARLGLLPGVLRRSLLESGRAREADLTLADLAGGFLIGNALRGLLPARLMDQ